MYTTSCTFTIILGNLFFYFFTLNEAYIIEVEDGPIEAYINQSVTLRCNYTIEPGEDSRPQINWYKGPTDGNNRILSIPLNSDLTYYPNEDTFNSTKFSSTRESKDSETTAVDLHVSGLLMSDSGEYTCDIQTTVQGTIELDVQGTSVFGFRTCNYLAPKESNAVLPCFVENHYSGLVTWKKNKQPYIEIDSSGNIYKPVDSIPGVDGSRYTVDLEEDNFPKSYRTHLKIANVMDDDFTEYTCMTETDSENGNLILAVDGNISVEFNGMNYTSTNTGSIHFPRGNVTLKAIVINSVPETIIYWDFNGYISGIKTDQMYTTEGECQSAITRSTSTFDLSKLEILDYIPQTQLNISIIAYNRITGNEISIKLTGMAESVGDDDASYIRALKNATIALGITLGIFLLVVSPILMFYTCCRKNKSPPGPPINVRVTSATNHTLTVEWENGKDSGDPQTLRFEVQYKGPRRDWKTGADELIRLKTTLTDLKSNTTYEVQVRSSNQYGISAWAPVVRPANGTTTSDKETV